jgi:hypothetical protein
MIYIRAPFSATENPAVFRKTAMIRYVLAALNPS